MLSDLRYAVRALARSRSFALVTILTLAVGIGSAASIFSVTDWVLFRANGFPKDVYLIGGTGDQSQPMPVRFDYMARAYAENTRVMSAFAKASQRPGNVVLDAEPVATNWLGVSANLLPMLGIQPVLGRGFLPGEDVESADRVVVVSHQFWTQHLGGRPDALGRSIRVGDAVCTVVGVLRAGQDLPLFLWNDVFRPLTYRVNPATPWEPNLYLFGQLRPGISREQAAQALAAAKTDTPARMRAFLADDHAVLSSMADVNRQFLHPEAFWMLLGAVGFLYAIACLNASNLMLVRMLGQRRELCIRLALGAGRLRVIRLLVAESAILGVLASLAGVLVANWLFPLLIRAAGNADYRMTFWNLDWRAVGVMAMLTVITSLLIVTVPAVRVLRASINIGLREGGAAMGESRGLGRLRSLSVVLQATFAVILLAGAGLMIRTLHHLQQVNLGFDPAGRLKLQIAFAPDFPQASDAALARLREIQGRLMRVPGVRAVGFGYDILLPGYYFATVALEGPEGKPIRVAMSGFGIGYQEAAGLTLRRGQWLTRSNGNEILVNESFAGTFWPGKDPVGQLVRTTEPNSSASADWKGWQVVGVVGDIRSTVRDAPGLFMYGPEGWGPAGHTAFILRTTRTDSEALAGAVRKELYAYDPRIVAARIVSLEQLRGEQLWAERMANSMLKVLAGIALVLTVVGVFSVLAYTVDRRMGEFGVRVALGATPRDLVRLVLSRGMALTLGGVVLGMGGTLALTRFVRSLLYETSAQDPWVLAAVGVVLITTSLAACIIPSLRATRVDVSRLLRSE